MQLQSPVRFQIATANMLLYLYLRLGFIVAKDVVHPQSYLVATE